MQTSPPPTNPAGDHDPAGHLDDPAGYLYSALLHRGVAVVRLGPAWLRSCGRTITLDRAGCHWQTSTGRRVDATDLDAAADQIAEENIPTRTGSQVRS